MTSRTALLATALGMLAGAAPVLAQVKAFSGGAEERKVTRVFYYTQTDDEFVPKGQFHVSYGSPTWQAKYDEQKAFDDETRGKRWRLGSGPWTALDTDVALVFNGVEVAPGHYYCVVERTADDKANLWLLDPAEVREQKLDAFQANATKGGTKVALEWTREAQKTAESLRIALDADKDDPTKVTFSVRWGPHVLTAPIVANVR